MPKKSHILFLICVFGLVSLGLTNGFADDDIAILKAALTSPLLMDLRIYKSPLNFKVTRIYLRHPRL